MWGDGGGWGLPQETEVRVCPHLSGIARDQPRTWMDALSLPAPFIGGSSDRARLGGFHSGALHVRSGPEYWGSARQVTGFGACEGSGSDLANVPWPRGAGAAPQGGILVFGVGGPTLTVASVNPRWSYCCRSLLQGAR